MTENLRWVRNAKCKDYPDPAVFFPTEGDRGLAAKAVCKECPVVRECLLYAVERNEESGVWGGMTVYERRKYRRQLRRHAESDVVVASTSGMPNPR